MADNEKPVESGKNQDITKFLIMTIASIFVIYAFVGKYLPGFLHHRGYSLQRVVCHLFYNTEGITGTSGSVLWLEQSV